MAFLLVMLLTGSRTGVLMAVFVVTFIEAYAWQKSRKKWLGGRSSLMIGMLVVCLAVGIVEMRDHLPNLKNTDVFKEDLIKRIEMLLHFKLSDEGGIKNSGSIQLRLLAQRVYWSLVEEKPLFGHGFGSNTYYQKRGLIFLSSHSQALTCAMEYGVLYPVAFVLLMLQLYRIRSRSGVEGIFQTNSIGQFVFITVFLFLINGGLLGSRVFPVVFGMFFAAVYCTKGSRCHWDSVVILSSAKRWPRPQRSQLHPVASIVAFAQTIFLRRRRSALSDVQKISCSGIS